MILVDEIYDEAKSIVGAASDAVLFRRLTDAVELLANKGEWDPMLACLDICVSCKLVTLPPEVETPLGVNILGNPAVARDLLFEFHLNGPGECGPTVGWQWTDLKDAPVYRELICPAKLIGFATEAADENAELWVGGFDVKGNVIRTEVNGEWKEGWPVPVHRVFQALPSSAPTFSRITWVRKARTKGPIRLSTLDDDGQDRTGMLLGVYQANETIPQYRRIQLSQDADYVRIVFRRRTAAINSRYDFIPLHNRQAVLMMLRALKSYANPGEFAQAEAFEATALRWLNEEQFTRTPPVVQPIQVHDGAPLYSECDHLD